MEKIEKAIEELLDAKGPMTISQISDVLFITRSSCMSGIRSLIEKGKIAEIKSQNSKRVYYFLDKKTTYGDVSNMHSEIAKETVSAKDTYEDLVEKYNTLNENVNGIYANIISIIAVFVAIFALITVNANIAFELTTQNMYDVFWGIVKINGFVVICIIALLIATRILIINPLLGKGKKKERD